MLTTLLENNQSPFTFAQLSGLLLEKNFNMSGCYKLPDVEGDESVKRSEKKLF